MVYINGIGAVSPQNTLSEDHFLDDVVNTEAAFLQILQPVYKAFIDVRILRRMSKIIRISVVAAKTAMNEAGITHPDAILTGTGMGCQADTEKFLNAVLDNNETLLNPTAFIQSTHNTMGAQIALLQNNNNYNLTFVNRGFSFESALLDSLMLIKEGETENILLGGIDEITDESWQISTNSGMYKSEAANNLKLLEDKQNGALSGEGANFFVLSSKSSDNSYAKIAGVDTWFKPDNKKVIQKRIETFLSKHEIQAEHIDLVVLGYNGDPTSDQIYTYLEDEMFANNSTAYYKHLSGEYDTAISFGVWLGAKIIKTATIPKIIQKRNHNGSKPKNILLYNHSRNIYHSLILLQEV